MEDYYEPKYSKEVDVSGEKLSPALAFKMHLREEIQEMIAESLARTNSKRAGSDRVIENSNISDIKFAYNNHDLISILK